MTEKTYKKDEVNQTRRNTDSKLKVKQWELFVLEVETKYEDVETQKIEATHSICGIDHYMAFTARGAYEEAKEVIIDFMLEQADELVGYEYEVLVSDLIDSDDTEIKFVVASLQRAGRTGFERAKDKYTKEFVLVTKEKVKEL